MSTTSRRPIFLQGAFDAAPFILVIAPFGLLFGVVATEAGLQVFEVMSLSVLVIAGASQFAALQQMVDAAPTLMVLATALAVNLRMAMYSAALTPWMGAAPLWKRAFASYFLVDQSYLLAIARFETQPEMSIAQRYAYFFGSMLFIAPAWYAATFVGAGVGQTIPDAFALDFAMPITFLAMVAPMLKSLAHVAAALTSVVLALVLSNLPNGAGLLVAAVAAMGVGAMTEVWMTARSAKP